MRGAFELGGYISHIDTQVPTLVLVCKHFKCQTYIPQQHERYSHRVQQAKDTREANPHNELTNLAPLFCDLL